jgi:hypothetical protein
MLQRTCGSLTKLKLVVIDAIGGQIKSVHQMQDRPVCRPVLTCGPKQGNTSSGRSAIVVPLSAANYASLRPRETAISDSSNRATDARRSKRMATTKGVRAKDRCSASTSDSWQDSEKHESETVSADEGSSNSLMNTRKTAARPRPRVCCHV